MNHEDLNSEHAVGPQDHYGSDNISLDRNLEGGSEGVVTQTGVKKVEAVAMIWTKQSLYVAYAG